MDNDERITRLEERFERLSEQTRLELQSVNTRLAKIEVRLGQTVTTADLAQAINSNIKWTVGTIFGAGVVAITVMTFVLNNAVPKQAPQPQSSAPVIIQVPPASQVLPKP
jgi:flagella basal body P-ring formation protein FlgA